MMRIAILIAAVLAGCVDESRTYLDVQMAPGHVDEPRLDTDWVTGRIAYDDSAQTLPPGVFTVRLRHEPSAGPALPITVAHVAVHPIGVCQAKAQMVCDAGACLGEAVQTTLGLCLLEITANVDGRRADACWFMGTYPRWAEATSAERDVIDERDCGGTSSGISAPAP